MILNVFFFIHPKQCQSRSIAYIHLTVLKYILFVLEFQKNFGILKGVRSRSLPKCDMSYRIDKFTLNPTVPFFMPEAAQNFEIFDSKVDTLCTGSYEGE